MINESIRIGMERDLTSQKSLLNWRQTKFTCLHPKEHWEELKNCLFISINKDVISFCIPVKMLAKHISRVSKEDEAAKKQLNQNISTDEWSHITEAGPKIDIQDPLDVSQRSIFFSKNQQASTKQEIVQEKAEEVKDQINNTNQYQKFVNVLLKERINNLKKTLDKEKQFAQELSCFQDTTKSRVDLEKVNPKYITENDTKSLIGALESEHDQMKDKLDHEQSVIEKTRNELQVKRQQIDQLKNELQFIAQKQKSQDNVDPVAMIKHELQKLGIKDDTGKIATALELLANKTKRDTI